MRFRNPSNGYVEQANRCGLWCLLFGCFYFASKGIWSHTFISAGAAVCTAGISWLIYPFFAKSIVAQHYLRHGWVWLPDK